jgi:hypothetical protein
MDTHPPDLDLGGLAIFRDGADFTGGGEWSDLHDIASLECVRALGADGAATSLDGGQLAQPLLNGRRLALPSAQSAQLAT